MKRYFQDIQIGEVTTSASLLLSRDDIVAYAQDYDPQPMHLSDEGAADTLFGSLVASGWHMASLTMRLVVKSKPFGETPLIGGGVKELKFAQKVLPDVTIYTQVEVTDKRERSGREFSFVELTVKTLNADDDSLLLSQKWDMVVPNKA